MSNNTERNDGFEKPQNTENITTGAFGVGTSGTSQTESTQQPTINWEEKYKEEHERYLRLLAEFDNYRKRQERERESGIYLAVSSVLREILYVFDEFERVVRHAKKENDTTIVNGEAVMIAFSRFKSTLQKLGVSEINIQGGYPDPEICEVVATIEVKDPEHNGKIIEIVEKGYMFRDRVLRHARVITGTYLEPTTGNNDKQ